MKRDFLKKKQRENASADLFSRTQNRLTFFYSTIISVFLIIFVGVVLVILFQVITTDQERTLRSLADQKMQEIRMEITGPRRQGMIDERQAAFLSGNQLFYYVMNEDGELIIANESISPLRASFVEFISGWQTEETAIRQASIAVPEEETEFGQVTDIRVLALSRPIEVNGETMGRMYIGLDISYLGQIFRWVIIVLAALAVLFIGLGVWLSYLMSKRALVPIKTSYNQQREFVANASHELRTPLAVLMSSIEALELEKEEDTDPFAGRMLQGMKQETRRMNRLIGDLLALARTDAAKQEIEEKKQVFDFVPVLTETVQAFKPLAAKKQIKLELDVPSSVELAGDPDKLAQLLYILLDNAVKYTPAGGAATVRLKMEKEQLLLSVCDSGIGISSEDQKRIFDRFYRGDKARTRKEGGHGLGLSIASGIAAAHNGTIQVTSEQGTGSIFTVRLPVI